MTDVKLYSDGAARGNPDGPGGYGAVLKFVDNAVSKAHNREMSSGDQNHRLTVADFE